MIESTTATHFDQRAEVQVTDPVEYVRSKLKLAITLACNGEQERRSGHWELANARYREWEGVMAEVKRLLPLVRASRGSVAPANPDLAEGKEI